MSGFKHAIVLLVNLLALSNASLVLHDHSFRPDEVLRVSQKNLTQSCQYRLTAVVNGTSPGPELRSRPNRTTINRVYNDLDDQNLTMVDKLGHTYK